MASDQPIAIHYQQMEEWLNDRRAVFGRKHKQQFESLMSLAPRLVQMAQYDIPAVQKQVKRATGLLEECYRVCEEADHSQESILEKRAHFLQEYGLRGVPPLGADQELQPSIDERIERSCATLAESLQTYSQSHLHSFSEFYEATLKETSSGMYREGCFITHFPWLSRVRDEDSLPTSAALRHDAHDANGVVNGAEAEEESAPQIDWGDVDLGASEPDVAAQPAVEIQWDAEEDTVVVHASEDDQLPEADGKVFSIDVSRPKDRANLVAELRSALCFASERARTTNETGDNPFIDASRVLLDSITNSIDALFVRMKTNFRAREAFEDDIRRFHRTWTNVLARKASHQSKAEELEKEVRLLEPQQASLFNATREVRDTCLSQLQVIFPERKVMIVGDINKYI